MMEAMLALLVATLASFVGSLQAGLVNTAVLAAAIRHGPATARRTAWGGALPEILYAAIAFVATDSILAYTTSWGITPGRITAVVLIGLGLYIALIMKPFHIQTDTKVSGGFMRGLALGLMNPQLALFWCGVRLGMESFGVQLHGWGALVGFSMGAFLGAMALLLLLIKAGTHLRDRLAGRALSRAFRALGAILVLAGVWAWVAA